MAVEITRKELTAPQLRSAASKAKDARAARRMLALALVLEGVDRETAARSCGMERQTLRDWVHRYNAEGLRGWSTAARRGGRHGFRRSRRPPSPRRWTRAPTRRPTGWCAGGAST